MTSKYVVCGICIIASLMLQVISADITTNEVNDGAEYSLGGVRVYPNDRECVLVGGLCVQNSDCILATSNKGLCPTSTHLGVECCFEMPVRPAPCAEHLGECMDRCHPRVQKPGTDCKNGQVCCLLL